MRWPCHDPQKSERDAPSAPLRPFSRCSPNRQMQFHRLRLVGSRRGFSTSRSTMPLINNNSVHIAVGFSARRGSWNRGQPERANLALRFLSVPRGPAPGTTLRRWKTVHWKINAVVVFVGYIALDTFVEFILCAKSHRSGLYAVGRNNLSFSCGDTINS